jgi:hypothetical protein
MFTWESYFERYACSVYLGIWPHGLRRVYTRGARLKLLGSGFLFRHCAVQRPDVDMSSKGFPDNGSNPSWSAPLSSAGVHNAVFTLAVSFTSHGYFPEGEGDEFRREKINLSKSY